MRRSMDIVGTRVTKQMEQPSSNYCHQDIKGIKLIFVGSATEDKEFIIVIAMEIEAILIAMTMKTIVGELHIFCHPPGRVYHTTTSRI